MASRLDKDADFDPTGKGHLLALHILLKGFQAGALFGTLIVTPIMAWKLRSRPRELVQKLPNAYAVSALTGIALAGAAGAFRMSGLTPEEIEDRVYRVHYNRSQNRTDLFATLSALVGAAAAGALLGRSRQMLAAGAVAGASVGVLAHLYTYRDEEEEDIAQKIEELQKNEAELRQMLEKRARKT